MTTRSVGFKALVLSLVWCLLPFAAGAGTVEDIRKRGVLVVGVTDQEPPFGYREDDGDRLVGYDIDFMNAVAERWGVQPRFKVVTPADRLGALLDGEVDIIAAGLSHSDARDAVLDFSDHYLVSGQKLIARRGLIRSHDDLEGRRLGAVVGTFAESCARDRCKVSQVVPFDDYLEGIEALQAGEIDAFTADEAILVDLFAGLPGNGYEIPDVSILREEYHLAVRAGDGGFRQQLNEAIAALQKDGETDRIRRKWYGTPEVLAPPAYGSVVRKAYTRPRFLGIILSGALVPGSDVILWSPEGQEIGRGTVASVLGDEFYLDVDPAQYDQVRSGFLVTMNMNNQMAMDALMRRRDVLNGVAAQSQLAEEKLSNEINREAQAKKQRAREMDTLREKHRVSTHSDRSRYYNYGRRYYRRGYRY